MNKALPFLMLVLRLMLFIFFQGLIAIFFHLNGNSSSWEQSEGWWIFSGLFTNIVTFLILIRLFNKEKIHYFRQFKFVKKYWWKDLMIFIGIMAISVPITTFPNIFLAKTLFGSSDIAFNLFFRPLPFWAIIIGFIWAISQGLVELPTYFAYAMPRIEKKIKNGWVAWVLASFFLAFQHVGFPLILNAHYMLWRLGMFLIFSFFAGLCIKLRPRLFPYMMIGHALMDIMVVIMLLNMQ